ncbi:cadherin-like beta sandwich domain-containing protein [Lysinibacillus odysseyi]|uniref:cadherin-like beta sandwich domain-containing protein n=2 Tax=Lysinibacillus odysseyi TaxID=202611 RepID=UPI001303CD7C|nr:cadherin-like beta sandwich domain-containing protein [Lysinibacillus odysseyi]
MPKAYEASGTSAGSSGPNGEPPNIPADAKWAVIDYLSLEWGDYFTYYYKDENGTLIEVKQPQAFATIPSNVNWVVYDAPDIGSEYIYSDGTSQHIVSSPSEIDKDAVWAIQRPDSNLEWVCEGLTVKFYYPGGIADNIEDVPANVNWVVTNDLFSYKCWEYNSEYYYGGVVSPKPNPPSALDLEAGSDSGSSNTDYLTSDDTPTFVGKAEANSTVTLLSNGTSIGTAPANGSGDWSFTPTTPIIEGTNTITATATNAGGTSNESEPLVITVDKTAPATGVISSSNITTSGVSLSWYKAIDNITVLGDLEYQIYQSTSSNFNTVGEVESGIPVSDRFIKDLNTLDIIGLSPNTTYYFNILVRDAAGNKSVYSMRQVTTQNIKSSNADLSSLSLSPFLINETFSSNTVNYTATVPYTTTEVPVTAIAADSNAEVHIIGASNGKVLLDTDGSTNIQVEVTAEDGTVKTYTIVVTEAPPSSNADLSNLTISTGPLNPVFSKDKISYTAIVPFISSTIIVTPTLDDSKATMMLMINNRLGFEHEPMLLNMGENIINIFVTAENQSITKIYTIKVYRLFPPPIVRGDDENNVLIPDTDAPIEYQINGGTWTTFDLANPPDLSGDKTVKVRYPANISTGQPASEEATLLFTENPKTESAPPHVTEATTEEDTMSTSGLVITPDAQDNNGVTHYKISEITGGTLYKNDGTFPIGNGDFITKEEGELGLKFHPDSDANTLAGDSFSVKVQASLDGTGSGLSEAATASITVTEVNDAPIAADDQLSEKVMTSEGIEIPFGELLQNDQAGPENENAQTLAIVSVSDIAGGTVHLEGKKVIFNPSGTGTASFNYTIQDNGTTDGTGDPKTASATVQFNVISKPLIYLEGDHTIYIELGSHYVEPGYSARDEIDGDLTDKVTVTGTVDRNQLGTYTLKYNVKNSKDVFAAEITRVVHVVSANLETLSVSSGNLIPSFDPAQTNYHLTVPSNATSIDISAGTLDETASATLNGETIGNSESRLITLRPGVNIVSIVITTQGGMTKSYTLEIIRQLTHAEVPVILHQPADQTVSIGGEADLSVNATSTNGGLSYQWYFNTTNSSVDGVLIPGATNATYSAPTSVIGTTYYYVKVTNTDSSATGNNTAEATSEVAAVTVNALTHAAVPAITVQPENKTVSVGDAADLSVDATAVKGELSYQWYSNTTNSNIDGTLIPSATNAIYAVPTGDAGTTYYYVKVTNTDSSATGNNTAEATSEVAAVTVKAKSTNAYLDDLTLSSGVLSPVFTKDRETYTVNVPNSVNNITFTPVVEDIGKATVTVNGQSSTTAVPLTVGVNVIKVVVNAEDGVTKNTYTITVNRAQPSSSGGNGSTPAPQPDPTPTPQPTTEQIVVDVDGNNGSHLTKTPITRTTEPNGTVKDKVAMTDSIAKETVQKAKEQGVDTASIIIPDKEDKVAEVLVEVPQSALDELNNGKLKLEIVTRNAVVSIPTKSLNNFEGNLYFRVVPIKSESEKQQVEDRAKNESLIQEAIGNNTVQVIGRPMEIETNMQSREVTIMLPLTASLPTNTAEREKLLTNLGVYIEHSDGSKELIKGTIVKMPDGSEGLQFTVNKFSTFTMVYLEGWEDEAADETLHTPYIKGYGNNEFRPEASVTRAQMATMLARNINAAPSKQAYTDVPTKHGAYEAIMEVKGAGIMMGKNVSTFDPNGTVTRAQMAAIVYRWVQNQCKQDAASYAGCAILKDIPVADFKDVKDNHWAKEAMNFTKATGIMVGDSKGQFRPEENLTRAQAVKVLNRLFKRGPLTGITTPTFKDVSATHWAFSEIEEAAREHLSSLDTTK